MLRNYQTAVEAALARQAAVAIIGPRQVGKTTLALDIGELRPSTYFDLQSAQDRARLADPEALLRTLEDRLVILDEIHQMPGLFPVLRGLIDQGRRRGHRTGRFLILGSASLDLLRQSGETLAGRIAYLELPPIQILESRQAGIADDQLWVRGGFPDALLAPDEPTSESIRRDFIRTYLERDIPAFNPRLPMETLRRLWTMLAHGQGTLLNHANLARNLGVSAQSINRYADLLVDLFLVRRLPSYHANLGKRLVKSPKIYVRDSGIVHSLLQISGLDNLLAHPVVGASWEGFVIEQIAGALPPGTELFHYRTSGGAEVDVVLTFPDKSLWAIEIKRSTTARPSRGFHEARTDLQPTRAIVVHPGEDRYPGGDGTEVLGVVTLIQDLMALHP